MNYLRCGNFLANLFRHFAASWVALTHTRVTLKACFMSPRHIMSCLRKIYGSLTFVTVLDTYSKKTIVVQKRTKY